MPNNIEWQLTATESISTTMQRIGQSLAGLDAGNAKTFGGMVRSLAGAETATIRAATALQRLETAETQTATAAQRLAQAETQAQAAQTRAATEVQRLAAAYANADAAQSRAAQAALRLQQSSQQAAQGIEQVGRAASQHSGAVSGFFSNALSAATGFLAANVFSRLAGGFTEAGGNAIGLAGNLEQAQVGFTGLLHSGDAANTMLAQLRDFANKSPFRFTELQADAEGLLGVGEAAQRILPDLQDVGNEIAGRGLNQQQLQQTILAYEQVIAKGHLAGQEALQFQNANIPIYQILSQALGKSIAQIQDLQEQGKLTADVVQQAFHVDAVTNFNGAMERQSRTWNGLSSTIQDVGETLLTSFGSGFIGQVEPALARITDALQNPQVAATLEQMGAAAGQFAVSLVHAGETAFNVAGQIIGALRPVTDLIGNLLGVQTNAGAVGQFTPPDFSSAAASAGQFGSAIQQGADNTKSAKDQVADLEARTRELSRAAAETQLGYEHQIDPLKEQIRVMDEIAQREDRAASIGELQKKIAKDRALAVDAYSSQGQSAASRLVDEEAQLAKQQREQGRAGAKDAIQDRIAALEQQKKSAQESAQAQERALARQQDALRATTTAALALSTALTGGPDKSRNRNVDDALGGAQTASKAQSTLGWLQQITDALAGDKGLRAAVDSVGTAWGQLTDAFKAADPGLAQLKEAIGEIAHALGLDSGFAAQAVIGQAAFKTFAEVSASVVPQNLAVVGAALVELNDQFAITARGLTLISHKLQGASDQTVAGDIAAFFAAISKQDTDRNKGVAGFVQKAAQGQQNTGAIFQQNYEDVVKGLLSAGKQGLVDSPATNNRADFGNGVISSTDRGGGKGADFAGVTTTTTSRNAPVQRHEVHISIDKDGVAHVIADATSSDRLLRVLGDAVR